MRGDALPARGASKSQPSVTSEKRETREAILVRGDGMHLQLPHHLPNRDGSLSRARGLRRSTVSQHTREQHGRRAKRAISRTQPQKTVPSPHSAAATRWSSVRTSSRISQAATSGKPSAWTKGGRSPRLSTLHG